MAPAPYQPNPFIPEATPVALTPRFRMLAPSSSVCIYEGPIQVEADGQSESKMARIELVWLPTPRVVIRVDDYAARVLSPQLQVKARLPGRSDALDVIWVASSISAGVDARPPSIEGIVRPAALKTHCSCASVRFHLANFPDFRGTGIRNSAGTKSAVGRVCFEADGWRITIDRVLPDGDSTGVSKRPEGTYLITHVGEVVRLDGQHIDGDSLEQIHRDLSLFLSFCRGAWTTPLLLSGHDYAGAEVWTEWSIGRVGACDGTRSWFNTHSSEGFGAFSGLSTRCSAELWREPIEIAMHWYVESNTSSDNAEGAIILQQAALELLTWTLLVEDRKVLSEDGVQKLPASDKTRLLLSTCGVPLQIPPAFKVLDSVAKAFNWCDGPAALTEVRNALVHANPAKRKRILGADFGARFEAWQLGQWYLELILLRVFEYRSHYKNRLHRGVWRGEEVEQVPWALTHA